MEQEVHPLPLPRAIWTNGKFMILAFVILIIISLFYGPVDGSNFDFNINQINDTTIEVTLTEKNYNNQSQETGSIITVTIQLGKPSIYSDCDPMGLTECEKDTFGYISNIDGNEQPCSVRSITHATSVGNANATLPVFTFTGLIPSQNYVWKVQSEVDAQDKSVTSKSTTSDCYEMKGDKPYFYPQADPGSFIYLPGDAIQTQNGMRSVALLWRPVPETFAGKLAPQWSYKVSCFDDESSNVFYIDTMKYLTLGFNKIEEHLFNNASYHCHIWSQVEDYISEGNSTIIIPKQDHIINFDGKLMIDAEEAPGHSYILRWSNASKIFENNSVGPLDNPIYTIYWCDDKTTAYGCSRIGGFLEKNTTSYELMIKNGKPDTGLFGVSYRSRDNTYFSGIVWSQCTRQISPDTRHRPPPLKLTASGSTSDGVILDWHPPLECKTSVLRVKEYIIHWCPLDSGEGSDPCSKDDTRSSQIPENHNFSIFEGKNCFHFPLPSMYLDTTYVVSNLSEATLYAFCVKYELFRANESNLSECSNLVYKRTLAKSESLEKCFERHNWMTIIGVITAIFVCLITVIKTWDYIGRQCSHYKETKRKRIQRIGLIVRPPSLGSVDVKYIGDWPPGQPSDSDYLLRMNLGKHNEATNGANEPISSEMLARVGRSTFCVVDYIPCPVSIGHSESHSQSKDTNSNNESTEEPENLVRSCGSSLISDDLTSSLPKSLPSNSDSNDGDVES